MKKSIASLFLMMTVLVITIIACQKEKQTVPPSNTTLQASNAREAVAINQASTRCRISLDTAEMYIKDYRNHMRQMGKQDGEYTRSYNIPADGLLDLFKYANDNHIKLSAIRAYIGRKRNAQGLMQETLVYVAADEAGNDLVPGTASIRGPRVPPNGPVEDGSGGCPPECNGNISNVLNNPK